MRIYCENCDSLQPFEIDDMKQDKIFPHQGIWGDINCKTCRLVIATLSVEDEGIYEFRNISLED